MSNTKVSSEQIIDDVALGGNPTTTTQSAGNNTTRVATTAFVTTAVSNLVDSAPSSLNTLNELAAAMNDNASFFSTVLPLSGGTMTGDLVLGDSVQIELGSASGGDLRIYHDGSNSHIKNVGSPLFIATEGSGQDLYLRADDDILIQPQGGENGIKVIGDGSVELYHNNSVKLETTTNGISTKGTSSNLITTSSTANDRAGAGFTATESATDGDRRANMYLDADNGAFSTGDSGAYFYIEKKGGGGLVSLIQQDNADLDIQTNGTRRLRVRGDGGVAIGNANDGFSSQILAVHAATADQVLYGESSDANCFASFRDNSSNTNVEFGAIGNDHVLRNDTTEKARFSGSNLHLGTGTDTRIQLGTGGAGANQVSNNTVHIRGDGVDAKYMAASGGVHLFESNGTELVRFTSDGVKLPSGKGIDFSATSDVSATSELLDDYEEGVYVATITCSTSGTATLNGAYSDLSYTKIGRLVTVTGLIIVSSVSSPVGYYSINLPFTPTDLTDRAGDSAATIIHHYGNTAGAGTYVVMINEYNAYLLVYRGDVGTTRSENSAEELRAGTQLNISATYVTA